MSPHAAKLLAAMAEGWRAERNESGYYGLVQYKPFMQGDAHHFSEAVLELSRAGLVDVSCNGSGACWINDKGRAANDASTEERAAWRLQDHAFQWTGDLAAFGHWFGEFMPINAYEQISVPTDAKRNRWLRVSCGNWIVRNGDECFQIENPLYHLIVGTPGSPAPKSEAPKMAMDSPNQ